jgi:hypothetical protein
MPSTCSSTVLSLRPFLSISLFSHSFCLFTRALSLADLFDADDGPFLRLCISTRRQELYSNRTLHWERDWFSGREDSGGRSGELAIREKVEEVGWLS